MVEVCSVNDNLVAAGVTSIQKNIGNGALINLTEVDIENIALPDGFTIKTISEFCLDTKSFMENVIKLRKKAKQHPLCPMDISPFQGATFWKSPLWKGGDLEGDYL